METGGICHIIYVADPSSFTTEHAQYWLIFALFVECMYSCQLMWVVEYSVWSWTVSGNTKMGLHSYINIKVVNIWT